MDCPKSVIIPNIFTPNDDGLNDVFHISGFSSLSFRVLIYNRWGKEVFKSDNPNFTWDGKLNDVLLPEGVYYYLIQSEGNFHNGFVQLIR
jgi:gliding motility-associated-like protein